MTYYAAHRDQRLAEARAYLAAHRDAINARRRAAFVANHDEISARHRAYQATWRAAHRAPRRSDEPCRCCGGPIQGRIASAIYCSRRCAARAGWQAYRAAHRDEIRVQQQAYRSAHLDETRVRTQAYRSAHRDEIRVRKQAYNAAHRDEIRVQQQAYNAAHRDGRRAHAAARMNLGGERMDIRTLPPELQEVARLIQQTRRAIRQKQTGGTP